MVNCPPILALTKLISENVAPSRMERLPSTCRLSISTAPLNVEPVMVNCPPILALIKSTSENVAPLCIKRLLSTCRPFMSSLLLKVEPLRFSWPLILASRSVAVANLELSKEMALLAFKEVKLTCDSNLHWANPKKCFTGANDKSILSLNHAPMMVTPLRVSSPLYGSSKRMVSRNSDEIIRFFHLLSSLKSSSFFGLNHLELSHGPFERESYSFRFAFCPERSFFHTHFS